MNRKQNEPGLSNGDPEVLCRLRDVAWLHDCLHVLQEIVIRKNGTGRLFRSHEFYGPTGEMNLDVNVPLSFLQQLEAEMEAGNIFSQIDGVPTFIEGLADSRVLLSISPGINRLRAFVDQLVGALPTPFNKK